MTKKFFLIVILLLIAVVGCSNNTTKTYVYIHFTEFWDPNYNVSERMDNLNGKEVTITGFMAMESPLDGRFIYLTNMPMVSCPYCFPGTNIPIYAIPVIAPKGGSIGFTEEPVTVKGILEVKEKIDRFGYLTPFRINLTSLKIAAVEKFPRSLQEYQMLTSEGINMKVLGIIHKLYTYTSEDFTDKDALKLEKIDLEEIDALINQVEGYRVDSFEQLVDILKKVKTLSIEINEFIINNEDKKVKSYREKVVETWEKYFEWANEMATIN